MDSSTLAGQAVHITSFGYLHGPAPSAHVTLDLREHFRDPHINPKLRYLTAYDAEVRAAVMATPGIKELLTAVVAGVEAFLSGPSGNAPVRIAIGCAGGRHRAGSTALALRAVCSGDTAAATEMGIADLAQVYTSRGLIVRLTHRDLHRDVVDRPSRLG
jgi:RNase adaptor protein for sRNA GlmZ degradation